MLLVLEILGSNPSLLSFNRYEMSRGLNRKECGFVTHEYSQLGDDIINNFLHCIAMLKKLF